MRPSLSAIDEAMTWLQAEYPRACSSYAGPPGHARIAAALDGLSDQVLRHAAMAVVREGLPRGLGLVAAIRQAAGLTAERATTGMPESRRLPTDAEEVEVARLRSEGEIRLRPDGWWTWCAKREAWRQTCSLGRPEERPMATSPMTRPKQRADWRSERAAWAALEVRDGRP